MIKRYILPVIIVILVVLLGVGLVGFNLFRDKAISDFFASMQQPAAPVSTYTVKPEVWTPNIEAIGTVSAIQGVELAVEVAGIVKEIPFKANQIVEQGAALLQLDDAIEKADIVAAKAQDVLADQTLARARTLSTRGVGAISNVDEAQSASLAKKAEIAKLQAVLDQKLIKAPFKGTVGIPRIEVGQYVSPGTVVVSLQDLATMRVDFTVPEQMLASIHVDQPIKLNLTDNDEQFDGQITAIEPRIDPSTRLVSVRAQVDNDSGKLRPGQFAQVRVQLPTEENVLTVPQTSLVSSLYGDYVFVVRPAPAENAKPADAAAAGEGEKPADAAKPAEEAKPAEPAANGEKAEEKLVLAQVFVTPGRRSGLLVEITKGLKPGDIVVTAGQNRLNPGSAVKIANEVNPANTTESGLPTK
ncbi:efflux RND transporter periplasmic adaptor subunit [Phyllobacterium sp. 21LDTY02-6]|jgi:membrane fusion protein, multidrug efflux system|uniref:efflux RND transporter periplasmic adaptor subunit n=1 Tax=unclassified Phyllobacterium TaxID=2638441 RepID=UPI0020219379|nr:MULTISPECIES: efflux RND transporter periplasmic adaptor subunit [unclassified Phyllobacterium]MCO4316645.1 efflux RND transporter periplasmic adaptor subunit [Phyllobacterium sp. 21LDTY02-6]MCX8282205.1 efflux RND transporter periplasmic adaptor subunit [Phyllobacterium sp. 0TCS1.6C]MCX8294893.1 efflux RND transporter periplasmic adaptor subunit [Phyllobacterium sp. 0TCS1.6A]